MPRMLRRKVHGLLEQLDRRTVALRTSHLQSARKDGKLGADLRISRKRRGFSLRRSGLEYVRYSLRRLVRLQFLLVLRLADRELAEGWSAVLLYHMGQLMGKELLSGRTARPVLPVAEKDLLPSGERAGA